jgi:hypothetical protein
MLKKLFRTRRHISAIELRKREIRIERDGLIEVCDGIGDAQFLLKIASGEILLARFFG